MLNRTYSPSQSQSLARFTRTRHASLRFGARALLWSALSGSRVGVAFRRQVVLGNAIVDFFAPSVRLVVEVDGAHHRLRRTADARRDRELRRFGCVVLRLDAQLVLRELARAVELIRSAVARLR